MKLAFLAAFFLVLISCSEDEATLPMPASKPPQTDTNSATISAPNRFEAKVDQYFYNPVGKRNPFEVYIPEIVQDANIPRSPLERYQLDELTLSGIIWGIADPRALIKAPDGYSYVVRADSRIGTKRGRVSKVTRTRIYVEEEYRDPTGKVVVKETEFQIRKYKNDTDEFSGGLRFSDD